MESDKSADNEKELTSTSSCGIGNILSTNKEEKNDSNDTLPTSSTDASTSFMATNLVPDDPISSTSSETDPIKTKHLITESEKTTIFPELEEVELLEMSMATVKEKIEENVDDLVNDLETLLGEPSQPFNLLNANLKQDKSNKDLDEVENLSVPQSLLEDEVSSNTINIEKENTQTSVNLQNEDISKIEETTDEISENCADDISNISKSNTTLTTESKVTEETIETNVILEEKDMQLNEENIDSNKCQSETKNVLTPSDSSDIADNPNIEQNVPDKPDCEVKVLQKQDELGSNTNIDTSKIHLDNVICDTDKHIQAPVSNSEENIVEAEENIKDDSNRNENIESSNHEVSKNVTVHTNVLTIDPTITNCNDSINETEHFENKIEEKHNETILTEKTDTIKDEISINLNKVIKLDDIKKGTDMSIIKENTTEENVAITRDEQGSSKIVEQPLLESENDIFKSFIDDSKDQLATNKLIEKNVDVHMSDIGSSKVNTDEMNTLDEQIQTNIDNEHKPILIEETLTSDHVEKMEIVDSLEQKQNIISKASDDVKNLPEQLLTKKIDQSIQLEEIEQKSELEKNESDAQSNDAMEKENFSGEVVSFEAVSDEGSKFPLLNNAENELTDKTNEELMDTSEPIDNSSSDIKIAHSEENSTKDADEQYTFNLDEDNSEDKLDVTENVTENNQCKSNEISQLEVKQITTDSSCDVEREDNATGDQQDSDAVTFEINEVQCISLDSVKNETKSPLKLECDQTDAEIIESNNDQSFFILKHVEKSDMEGEEKCSKININCKLSDTSNDAYEIPDNLNEKVSESTPVDTTTTKAEEDVIELPTETEKLEINEDKESGEDEEQVISQVVSKDVFETDELISPIGLELTQTESHQQELDKEQSQDDESSIVVNSPAGEIEANKSVELLKSNILIEPSDIKIIKGHGNDDRKTIEDENIIIPNAEEIQKDLIKDNINMEVTEDNNIEEVPDSIIKDEITQDSSVGKCIEVTESVQPEIHFDEKVAEYHMEVTDDNVNVEIPDGIIKDELSQGNSGEKPVDVIEPEQTEMISAINVTELHMDKEIKDVDNKIEDNINDKLADGDFVEERIEPHIKEKITESNEKEDNVDITVSEKLEVISVESVDTLKLISSEECVNPVILQSDASKTINIEDQVVSENCDKACDVSNMEVGMEPTEPCHPTEKLSSLEDINIVSTENIQKESDEVDKCFDTKEDIIINKAPSRHENRLCETLVADGKKLHSEINIRRKTVEQDLEKVVCLSEESSDSDGTESVVKDFKESTNLDQSDNQVISSTPSLDDQVVSSMPLSDDQVSTSVVPLDEEQQINDVPMTEENFNLEETDLIKIAKQVEHQGSGTPNLLSDISSDEKHDLMSIDQEETDRPPAFSLHMVETSSVKANMDDRNLSDKELRDIEAIRAAVASITDSSQDTYDSYLVDSSVTENILPEGPELSRDAVDIQESYSNLDSSSRPIDDAVQSSSSIGIVQKSTEIVQSEDSCKHSSTDSSTVNTCEIKNVEIDLVTKTSKEAENVLNVQQLSTDPNKKSRTPKETISEKVHVTIADISENVLVEKINAIEDSTKEIKSVVKERNLGSITSISNKIENIEDNVLNEKKEKNKARKSMKINEPLSISIEDVEREKIYSPKVTIKPVKVPDDEVSTTSDAEVKGSLKMTITKQSDKMHSILKVFNPDDDSELGDTEEPIPKLIIKPKHEQQHSPKTPSRSSKVYSPTSTQRCGSPRVTIKPVIKPVETKNEPVGPLKITFKPVVKTDETTKRHSPKSMKEQDQKNHNPKITIKPIPKPQEQDKEDGMPTTPKLTIKPIKRPHEDIESDMEQEKSSPKITIKPVVRSSEDLDLPNQSTPRLIIKPIKKQEEEMKEHEQGRSSPKISIKPIVKPTVQENEEEIEEVKKRIVLKINKGTLPTPGKDKNKREYPEDEKSEKLGKIKLKFSTSGGHPHIVQEDDGIKKLKKDIIFGQNPESSHLKRALDEKIPEKNKRLRTSVTPERDSKIELQINEQKIHSPAMNIDDSRANALANEDNICLTPSTTKITDLASRPIHVVAAPALSISTTPVTPTPKKRGRPRKVPLEVRPELIDPINPNAYLSTPGGLTSSGNTTPESTTSSGGRPKRSCRGQNVIATLGIKPRKPRGRGRGSKVNMGDRMPVMVSPIQTVSMKPEKDSKLNKSKFKLMHKVIEEEVKRQQEHLRITGPDTECFEGTDTVKKENYESSILQVALESKRLELLNPQNTSSLTDTVTFKHLEVAITKTNFLDKSFGDDTSDNVTKRACVQIGQNETIIILTDDEEDKSNVQDDEMCYDRSRDRKLLEEYKLADTEMTEGRELEEATEDDDDAGDSEEDRRRQLVKQRKQEAIKKCRAKRMEKLAKAAEIKRKRQEVAKLQREARLAAEEAEREAAEKARINRRYGRYGKPKPQISLIDEPVCETDGTVKSQRSLFNSNTEAVKVSQSSVIVVDEDSNQQVLKADSSNNSMPSTSNQSANPQKYVAESMQVDLEDNSMADQSIGADDLVMMDEETRMSADLRGSRAHTPAKHSIAPIESIVEDSQGSLGTTESGKSKNAKAPRLEVHQESDGNAFTADQLAEYFWSGQGPFMLQEQVAHFLGIKSFKRKYPHVSRRSVEIQERDFLKEQGLASETMCDLGLTAVNAQDILDIMYSDFQDKYEEYCRVQREKQARDFANKQKATQQALKSGYERLDIIEQAVQSAAQWNKQFNKERKEQRKASMDLQNLTVHYPKSKIKPVQTRRIGNYPVALVPGQFTDFYKEFTPTELNNLPLNTMCYDEIKVPMLESESDDSDSSESDSETSSSSSSSDSECGADCKECNTHDVMGRGGKNITTTKESNTTVGTPA